MKEFVIVLGIIAGCVLPPRAWADQRRGANTSETTLAARVNGESVTRAEVTRLLASAVERRQLLQEPGASKAAEGDLDRLAVQTLIRRRLILQEAARRKLTVSDQEVDKAVKALRLRFDDLKGLAAWMRDQGLDERSLFETIRVELLASRVRAALVEHVTVAEEQISEYYDAHKDELKIDEVRLQIIVVTDEKAAHEIMTALGKGADFGALAQQHSIGRRASTGGDTGWVDADTLWRPLREAVHGMEARQARGPLRRDNEFLIVRLDGRRVGRTKTPAEARLEIVRRLLPARHQAAVQAWLIEQEKKSTIEIFPRAE